MTGKSKCKILKDIRREIAERNDIEFLTSECKFQGECSGTCPKCESEVRYLEQELAKRQNAGKAIAVAGIAAALMVGVSGCVPDYITAGAPLPGDEVLTTAASAPTEESIAIPGDVPYVAEETQELVLGELPLAGE